MISTPGTSIYWLHIVQNEGTERKLGKMNIEEKTRLSQIRLTQEKLDSILREQNIEI